MRLFIISISLLVFKISFAQQTSCNGKVMDEANVPLSAVLVENSTQRIYTYSNNNGLYSLRCNPKDTLRFKLLGYEVITKTGEEVNQSKVVFLPIHRYQIPEVSIQKKRSLAVGYFETRRERKYPMPVFRQSSIIQFFKIPKDSFLVKKFRFYIKDYPDSIDLKIRVTIGEHKIFDNEESYSVLLTDIKKNAMLEFDFNDFKHVFLNGRVYVKIEFLDNGFNICKDKSSEIKVRYAERKKLVEVTSYTNFEKFCDGDSFYFMDSPRYMQSDPMTNLEIEY